MTIPAAHPFPTSTNSNCLDGVRCPQCGSEGPFEVVGTALFTVHDDGTDEGRSPEWDATSPMTCPECGHRALAALFFTDLGEVSRMEAHLSQVCEQAQHPLMQAVLSLAADRQQVTRERLLDLTAQDVTALFEQFVAPAVDAAAGAVMRRG